MATYQRRRRVDRFELAIVGSFILNVLYLVLVATGLLRTDGSHHGPPEFPPVLGGVEGSSIRSQKMEECVRALSPSGDIGAGGSGGTAFFSDAVSTSQSREVSHDYR